MAKSIIGRISVGLDEQIKQMIKKIKDSFGIDISYSKASKIVDWKGRSYNLSLTEKKLLEILGEIR